MNIKELYKPNVFETANKLRKDLNFARNPNIVECYNENLRFKFWIEETQDGIWTERGICDKNIIKIFKVYDSEKTYCDFCPVYKNDTAISLSTYKWILETAKTIKDFCDFAVRDPFEISDKKKKIGKDELINHFGQWTIVLC